MVTTHIEVGMLRLTILADSGECVLMNVVTGEICRVTLDDLVQIAERILQDRDPGDPLWKTCPMVSWLATRVGRYT